MLPWTSRHIGVSQQGHPRYTDARMGRPWMAHNTIHSATNVHNQKELSSTTYMVAEPCSVQFSSVRIQQQTERRYDGQEVDGQFVGSRKQPRQRTQGDTLDSGYTKSRTRVVRRTRVTRHQHSGDETVRQHPSLAQGEASR